MDFSERDLPTGGTSEQLEVVELPMVRMKLVSYRRFSLAAVISYTRKDYLSPMIIFLLTRFPFDN